MRPCLRRGAWWRRPPPLPALSRRPRAPPPLCLCLGAAASARGRAARRMSWFNASQLSSFAKQALSQAQKSIDRVLDIQAEESPWPDAVIPDYGDGKCGAAVGGLSRALDSPVRRPDPSSPRSGAAPAPSFPTFTPQPGEGLQWFGADRPSRSGCGTSLNRRGG